MMISQAREAATSTPAPKKHAPPPPKSQPLHNFSLPLLKWGSKRTVRSDKPDPDDPEFTLRSYASYSDSGGRPRHPSPDLRRTFRRPSTSSSPSPSKPQAPLAAGKAAPAGSESLDPGIEEIREKLLVHLRTAAKKMKFQVPEEGGGAASVGGEEEESSSRPWNLRTRRAACRALDESGEWRRRDAPASPPENSLKSCRLRSMAAERNGGEKKERRKFAVALSKDEIEEDFFIMTGSRPARRPKKRARIIQKQVDMCFPGMWLSEVTLDAYKVPDFHESAKR